MGGDEGQSWAERKVKELDAEKSLIDLFEFTVADIEEKATPIRQKNQRSPEE